MQIAFILRNIDKGNLFGKTEGYYDDSSIHNTPSDLILPARISTFFLVKIVHKT